MSLPKTIQEIRQLLRQPDKLPEAFRRMEALIETDFPHQQPALTTLQTVYNKNESEYTQGLIPREAYLLEFRRIVNGIVKLLVKLTDEERRLSGKNIQLGSELAVVSCDRKQILKRFWLSFERREEEDQKLHTYLLAEQKYGQADSLVKRLITNLKEEKKTVKYSGFNQIEIRELDIGAQDEPADCRFFFRKKFNAGLDTQVRTLAEFAGKIDTRYPGYRSARYIPLAFKLNMTQRTWPTTGQSMLEWITQTFCRLEETAGRTFVLFFILNIRPEVSSTPAGRGLLGGLFGKKKEKGPSEEDIHQLLKNFTHKCAVPPTILPPLNLVRREDLLDWYKRYEHNERLREEKTAILVRGLPTGDAWHMSDVEKALATVVEEYQHANFGI